MPVYRLCDEPIFPPAADAEPSGLLAVGGDLSPVRLLVAYASGIFPWYSDGEPILWFSPDPRMVLEPEGLRPDRGMRRNLEGVDFELRMDSDFERVIRACAGARRPDAAGTWITPEMIRAYCELHDLGFAHSVEAWQDGELVGGVYGVALGTYFSGESMFHARAGASIAALVALVVQLRVWGFRIFDCQTYSRHVERLGARPWLRRRFLDALSVAVAEPTRRGRWSFDPRILVPGAPRRL
jgi:leucyl/phenylalanyl-tRNA--protein transferase